MNFVSNLINGVSNIGTYISDIVGAIQGLYEDVNFGELFSSIFPQDMTIVTASVLTIIIFISLISLIKKCIVFLGG